MFAFVDFKPAELKKNKDFYVEFYVRDPLTDKMARQRVRLNHIKTDKIRFAKLITAEINQKLYSGWNPLVEKLGASVILTVGQAVDKYRIYWEKTLRPESLKSYRSYSNIFLDYIKKIGFDRKPLLTFKRAQATGFMVFIDDRGVGAVTYNNYLNFCCQMFKWFVEMEFCKDSVFTDIKSKREDKKIRKIIPPDVRQRIMEYFQKTKQYEYIILCMLTYKCLVRPHEILNLRIGDIDKQNKIIRIPASVAKNHHERIIALPNDIAPYLCGLSGSFPSDYFIFGKSYKPSSNGISTRITSSTWRAMRGALELPEEYQYYSLKDTAITEMLEKGVPAKIVQQLADHSSLQVTQKYVALTAAEDVLKYTSILEF